MEVILAVLAAAASALGSVFQRRGAARAPDADSLRLRLVWDLLRQPVWAVGIASMIVGIALQALALHGGALALVEPVIILELPFTLLCAALIFRKKVEGQTVVAILVTTGALSGLLVIARPSSGRPQAVPAFAWVLALAVTAGMVAALVGVGRRFQDERRAALLATAAGAGHGLSATLMKATIALASHGVLAIFSSWKLYGVIVAGAGSLYLFENALQAGAVMAAQPGVTITDPLVSVLFGLLLFGEHVRAGVLIVPEVLCAGLIVAGIALLARSPLLLLGDSDGARRGRSAIASRQADGQPSECGTAGKRRDPSVA